MPVKTRRVVVGGCWGDVTSCEEQGEGGTKGNGTESVPDGHSYVANVAAITATRYSCLCTRRHGVRYAATLTHAENVRQVCARGKYLALPE